MGPQQEKGIRRFALLNSPWNQGRHELDLESSSVVPLPALCFVAAWSVWGNPFFPLHYRGRGRGASAERGQPGEDASVSDV